MKNLMLIFFTLIICTYNQICAQNLPEHIQYVIDPNPNDSTCISGIQKAKNDISQGKIVLTETVGLNGVIRYQKELIELCRLNGIEFRFIPAECIYREGQTEGCYSDYMEKVIIDKFGLGFKEELHKKADSLFLIVTESENNIIQYYDCDERPRLPYEIERLDDFIPEIIISKPNIKEKKGDDGGWPFFDIGFIVEKDSTISGFYSNHFVAQLQVNEALKKELYLIAIKHIKETYPLWVPGKINGAPVRTDNNVRVYFTKKE